MDFNKIGWDNSVWLENDFREELRVTVECFGGDKAPDLDGVMLAFFNIVRA